MAKDKNFLPALIKNLRIIQRAKINVGILGKKDSDVLNYARSNEFGDIIIMTQKMRNLFIFKLMKNGREDMIPKLPKVGDPIIIPSRSYLRSTFDDKNAVGRSFKTFGSSFSLMMKGSVTAKQALDVLGDAMVNEVRKTITKNIKPKNNELTIAIKGKGKGTLRDSGRLFRSVGSEVLV